MISHESVLNRVHNFVQVLIWPIRVDTLNAFLTHFNNPTPIQGCAAGPGYDFRRLCPKEGYIISHDSVLNRVHNFLQVCPKQCA